MQAQQFQQYAEQGYNRIPVVFSTLADLDNPLSVYYKLAADQPYTYLLESVQGGEKWARYSFIGLPCKKIIRVFGNTVEISEQDNIIESFDVAEPLQWLADYQAQYKAVTLDGLPRFSGGLVGYFSYDTIRYAEKRLADCPNPHPLGTPDILLMVSDEVVAYDNLANQISIIINVDPADDNAYDQAQQRITELRTQLQHSTQIPLVHASESITDESALQSNFSKEDFKRCVEKIKQYTVDGDCMQVVPSQRLSLPFDHPPFELYRAIRTINPSPYMYYFNLNDFHIVGASPEILVRVEDDTISIRPLAGTRPRGKTAKEDKALEQDLLADPKEIAEHLMLIDLARNDVGRVSETGTVKVTDQMAIERYSHVMHIVSHVEGKIKPDLSAIDILASALPAGTLSGAPKVRAMEIIDEVENVKRGIYGGAVGYWGWDDTMDMAIAIRTAVIKNKVLYNQVGAGIVADSDPESEWQETLNKGRAIFKAINMIEKGF
tara:strand:+ start:40175 stop:41650 length:1476 start_codon:yes stop_codon:yes gene_type:complete